MKGLITEDREIADNLNKLFALLSTLENILDRYLHLNGVFFSVKMSEELNQIEMMRDVVLQLIANLKRASNWGNA